MEEFPILSATVDEKVTLTRPAHSKLMLFHG